MKLEFSPKVCEKYLSIKFHENRSSGNRAVPCGRTDIQTIMKNSMKVPRADSRVTCERFSDVSGTPSPSSGRAGGFEVPKLTTTCPPPLQDLVQMSTRQYGWKGIESERPMNGNLKIHFWKSTLTMTWRVLRLHDGEGLKLWRVLRIYWISNHEQPKTCGPPAWGLGEVITPPHSNNWICYEAFHKASGLQWSSGTKQAKDERACTGLIWLMIGVSGGL
jgi:hypothetical protein